MISKENNNIFLSNISIEKLKNVYSFADLASFFGYTKIKIKIAECDSDIGGSKRGGVHGGGGEEREQTRQMG